MQHIKLKNALKALAVGATVSAIALTATADTQIKPLPSAAVPVINSQSASSLGQTNWVFGPTTNGIWPTFIPASTTVTNVTALNAIGTTGINLAFQLTGASAITNGGTVTVQLARNLSGGLPTNAIGTGLALDLFATVTNIFPPASSNNLTGATSCQLFGPVNGQGYSGGGPVANFYIYSITTPAGVILTNYQIYVNSH